MADEEQGYGFQVVNPITQSQQPVAQKKEEDNPLLELLKRGDMLKIIQEYLQDKNIPASASEKFWGIHSKFLAISFFDKTDVEDLHLMAENVELIDIMSHPPQEYTWDKMQDFEQVKIFLLAQIRRSIGTTQGRVNERTLQNTQIGHMITTQVGGGAGQPSGGGLKGTMQRIFG